MINTLHIFGKKVKVNSALLTIDRYSNWSNCSIRIKTEDRSDFIFEHKIENKDIQPSDLENLFLGWNDISRIVYLYIETLQDTNNCFLPTLEIQFGRWDENAKILEVYVKGSVKEEDSFDGIEQFEIYCGCTYIPGN